MGQEVDTGAAPKLARADSGAIRYTAGAVVSADGTPIGFRQLGQGPGIILLHGGMMASQNLMRLSAALSGDFTVYVPDRRGRGSSGAFGDDYGAHKECEDLRALIDKTGSHSVFGLSSGAIVALQSALTLPIHKLALYEPPLVLPGSLHTGWMPRYEREIARGKLASAMVTVMKGTGDPSALAFVPRFLLVPFLHAGIGADAKDVKDGDVPMKALIPTMHFDAQIVKATAGSLETFRAVEADVLLLGGAKSALYLRHALDALGRVLPKAQRVELPGVGHLAADNSGKPKLVATKLRAFFASA